MKKTRTKKYKLKKHFNKLLIIILIICFLFSGMSIKTLLTNYLYGKSSQSGKSILASTATPGVKRTADNNTMNSYKDALINDINGSRYAGRIWTDKSVFAYGETSSVDGITWQNNILSFGNNDNQNQWQVETSDDFLNVFSALASSQQIIQQHRAPLDIVLVLDMSGSMGDSVGSNKSRIEKAADAINKTLEEISEMDGARVGLQIYSSVGSYNRTQYAGFQTVFPLDHYTKLNNNDYLTVTQNSSWFGSSGDYKIQFRAKNSSNNTTINTTITSTGGTTTQMGIYEGMKMLAEAKDVTEDIDGETLHRTPVMILITDGVPTYISNGDWWKPTITSESQQLGDGSKNADGLNFATMLTAAYMKKIVNQHYYGNEKGSNGHSARIFTISVDTDEQNKDIMESTFNPKDKWDSESDMSKKLKTYWQSYQNNQQPFDVKVTTCSSTFFCKEQTYSIKHPTSTTEGISDLTEEDMKYNNSYYDVQSANLQEIFSNIMDSLSSEIFNPVEGTNSAGVNNSLTFAEPLGLYMEVKDKAIAVNNPVEGSENIQNEHGIYDMAILLYNQMHGIVKTAVYDESFVESHSNDGNEFKAGWYSSNGSYLGTNSEGSWSNGDTYYVDKQTALQFVPTIPEKSSSSSDNEDLKHIVYTLYRFAENTNDRNTTISNPCYGGNSEVTFKLSDIRIWVEESGNYVNQSGMIIPGSGYDSMLYINLPSNAIPSEVAKITLDEKGNIAKYDTNIDEKGISNPLRVFYSVGIKDEYLTEDNLDMDLTKVSQEYIEHFKNDDGSLNFFDSYWSKSTYDDYENEDKRTRGDTTLSFSPSQSNKYYFFQKNLALYTDAYYIGTDGSTTHIDDLSKYENKTLAKIYDGKSDNKEIPEDIKKQIQSDFQNNTISQDTIVILSQDVITDTNGFTKNGTYYIIDDYYVPDKDGKGKKVEIVIQRSGQDFSLGTEGESEQKGDYLCWKAKTRNSTETYDFNAKPSNDDYVLSTKVGALRVGNLSSNIGTKENNKTETAYNYYIPTISATKENDDVDITNYLGNNGRLIAQDSLLMITKELEGTLESEEDDQFNFEVYIEGKEGNYQGIIVKKHNSETGIHWDYIIEKIEVVVDQDGYLLAPDDSKAVIEHNGQKYIMKLHNKTDFDKELSVEATQETDENTDGIQKFYVMVDYYNESNSNTAAENNQKVYVWETATGNTENGNKNKFGDKFKTKSSYKTQNVKFGYKKDTLSENTYPDEWTAEDKELEPYTTNITLKPDEGILINGIKTGSDYKVTEIITKNQDTSGVNFKSIEHKMNNSTNKYTYESNNTDAIPGDGANGFQKNEDDDKNNKTYMIFGDTGSNLEEVHYTNYDKLKHLTISKSLEPEEGTTITNHDKNIEFPFNISFHTLDNQPLNTKIEYKKIKIDEKVTDDGFTELQLNGNEGETFSFHLKADEQIVFDKLPLDTGYKYELIEEATDGYESENSTIKGVVEANSDGVMPQTVHNIKLVPKIDVSLTGTKTLIGDELQKDEFEFVIIPNDNNPEEDPIKEETIVSNDDKGQITFINKEYTKAGTYNYHVKEKKLSETDIIYDTTEYDVKVTITETPDEKLLKEIEITSNGIVKDNITFTNIRVKKDINLSGTKELIGKSLEDQEFSFVISPDTSNPQDDIINHELTVTNDTLGHIEFLKGTYTNIGTYLYHIKEVIPNETDSIIYDETKYDVKVTISLDEYNQVVSQTDITHNGTKVDEIIFKNINVNEQIELTGTKHLTGGSLNDDEFSFVISPDENNPKEDPIKESLIVKNKSNGSITFINHTYTKVGKYLYHIYEDSSENRLDIIYDKTSYDVTVDIQNINGVITSQVSISNNDVAVPRIEFTNYIIAEQVTLNGMKYLAGKKLEDKEFSFTITPNASNPEGDIIKGVTTVSNDDKGNIQFINGKYQQVGIYKYEIKEVIPDNTDNIKYDSTIYNVTITVSLVDGVISNKIDIKANNSTRGTISFNNAYQETSIKLNGLKSLIGKKLQDEEFSFTITPNTSNPKGDILTSPITVKNDASGNITFIDGKYHNTGIYKYKINENTTNQENHIEYDKSIYDITITIDEKVDGSLTNNIVINKNNNVVNDINFTNYYINLPITISGTKYLEGKEIEDQEFSFAITPNPNNPLGDALSDEVIVKNDASGNITFINGNYTEIGTYKYKIKELIPEELSNIKYDTNEYEIIISISIEDNKIVKNINIISNDDATKNSIEFVNIFQTVQVELNGQKILKGDKLKGNDFNFMVIPDPNNPLDDPITETLIISNDENGNIPLIKQTYQQAGTYKYIIKEQIDTSIKNIKYDEIIYEVTIVIDYDDKGLLTKNISITSNDNIVDNISFTNNTKFEIPNTLDYIGKHFLILFITIITMGSILFIYRRYNIQK